MVHGPRALVQADLRISCWAFATPPASWMGGSSMWMGLDFRGGHRPSRQIANDYGSELDAMPPQKVVGPKLGCLFYF